MRGSVLAVSSLLIACEKTKSALILFDAAVGLGSNSYVALDPRSLNFRWAI